MRPGGLNDETILSLDILRVMPENESNCAVSLADRPCTFPPNVIAAPKTCTVHKASRIYMSAKGPVLSVRVVETFGYENLERWPYARPPMDKRPMRQLTDVIKNVIRHPRVSEGYAP